MGGYGWIRAWVLSFSLQCASIQDKMLCPNITHLSFVYIETDVKFMCMQTHPCVHVYSFPWVSVYTAEYYLNFSRI